MSSSGCIYEERDVLFNLSSIPPLPFAWSHPFSILSPLLPIVCSWKHSHSAENSSSPYWIILRELGVLFATWSARRVLFVYCGFLETRSTLLVICTSGMRKKRLSCVFSSLCVVSCLYFELSPLESVFRCVKSEFSENRLVMRSNLDVWLVKK